jgi:hypothetical protein
MVFQLVEDLCARLPKWEWARAGFSVRGPDRASFSPVLFILFIFPFSAKLGKF